MRYRALFFLILAGAAACSNEPGPTGTGSPPPPPAVLLRDLEVSSLPSPYYHFEYDTGGRVKAVSFASELRSYDVIYDRDRIAQMRNKTNGDTLDYVYDDAGRVSLVKYVSSSGVVYTVVFFTYDGQKLTGVERDRRVEGGFLVDKTTKLSYYADGNLKQITEHRPAIDGEQTDATTIDLFEQYDAKVNVEGFGLIHDDFFDHLILLPGVELQRGNPARQTRTGDGVNFTVDYSYTYDEKNRPRSKTGAVTITNGTDAGRTVQTSSVFSYY